MNHIPRILIFSRMLAGVLLIALSFTDLPSFKTIAVSLIAYGLLSDIFDGIIARRLGISTVNLRRLDSAIDQVFWISTAFAAYLQCPEFFVGNSTKLFILFAAEGTVYVVSFFKFRKDVATHALASKVWALSVCATLIQVVLTCRAPILFEVCFYLGVATRLEIIGILLILNEWTSDVPSLYHAVMLRRGRVVKRHKWFNG